MAKKSMIAREKSGRAQVAKYAAKRAALKAILKNPTPATTRSGKRRSSCRSCRATPARFVSSVAAR